MKARSFGTLVVVGMLCRHAKRNVAGELGAAGHHARALSFDVLKSVFVVGTNVGGEAWGGELLRDVCVLFLNICKHTGQMRRLHIRVRCCLVDLERRELIGPLGRCFR